MSCAVDNASRLTLPTLRAYAIWKLVPELRVAISQNKSVPVSVSTWPTTRRSGIDAAATRLRSIVVPIVLAVPPFGEITSWVSTTPVASTFATTIRGSRIRREADAGAAHERLIEEPARGAAGAARDQRRGWNEHRRDEPTDVERRELDERRRARGLELRHASRVVEPDRGDAGDIERLEVATVQIDLADLVRRSREQHLARRRSARWHDDRVVAHRAHERLIGHGRRAEQRHEHAAIGHRVDLAIGAGTGLRDDGDHRLCARERRQRRLRSHVGGDRFARCIDRDREIVRDVRIVDADEPMHRALLADRAEPARARRREPQRDGPERGRRE